MRTPPERRRINTGSHLNKPKNWFGVYFIKMWKMDTTIPMSLCCATTERSQSSETGSLNVTKTTQNPLGFSLTTSLASASLQLNLLLQSESATLKAFFSRQFFSISIQVFYSERALPGKPAPGQTGSEPGLKSSWMWDSCRSHA